MIISGSFEAKIYIGIQQTWYFCDFLRIFDTSFQKNVIIMHYCCCYCCISLFLQCIFKSYSSIRLSSCKCV